MAAFVRYWLALWLAGIGGPRALQGADWGVADAELDAYFRAEVSRLSGACLAEVKSLADWEAQREERRRQLFDMLGLWPLPARTDLRPVITRRIDTELATVENLHFQSLPGLYVTANLYLPRGLTKRAPAILYVCGHAEVKTNGISLGNKTAYQHHGLWFARNGYVCLTLDTLQLGEIQGDHHGTHRLGQWWWNSRGYTPAGVEAWNSIRALDYLVSRPEVDPARLGMTGRSGGGSYTWTTAALDERVRVAAPVAGITDLRNHVVDGCVEGHCDCMFFVNTYRWDFGLNAALIAPRPLLIVNTDADSIFPLDGVQRVHAQVRKVYGLYDARDNLGLVIGPGPHKDTQDLQIPVFRWFNRHLKEEDPLVEDAARKTISPLDLRVFQALPADQVNTRIQETFVPLTQTDPSRSSSAEGAEALRRALREFTFAGWPAEAGPVQPRVVNSEDGAEARLRVIEFQSQPHVGLRLVVLEPRRSRRVREVVLHVLDAPQWTNWSLTFRPLFPRSLGALLEEGPPPEAGGPWEEMVRALREGRPMPEAHAWFAPRGIGWTAWPGDARKQAHLRRRFMLLGQTVDGMRVWDIRQAAEVVRGRYRRPWPRLSLEADGGMAFNVALAALFEPAATGLRLSGVPASPAHAPDYLNLLKHCSLAEAIEAARHRQ
jgi:dienelactone hydrolase